jgi:hypothetical protein
MSIKRLKNKFFNRAKRQSHHTTEVPPGVEESKVTPSLDRYEPSDDNNIFTKYHRNRRNAPRRGAIDKVESPGDSHSHLIGFILGGFIFLLAVSSHTKLTYQVADVGDHMTIVPVFAPTSPMTIPAQILKTVFDDKGVSCSINLNDAANANGMFTVQAVRQDGVVVDLSETSAPKGETTCPLNTTLLVSADNYMTNQRLAIAQAEGTRR